MQGLIKTLGQVIEIDIKQKIENNSRERQKEGQKIMTGNIIIW